MATIPAMLGEVEVLDTPELHLPAGIAAEGRICIPVATASRFADLFVVYEIGGRVREAQMRRRLAPSGVTCLEIDLHVLIRGASGEVRYDFVSRSGTRPSGGLRFGFRLGSASVPAGDVVGPSGSTPLVFDKAPAITNAATVVEPAAASQARAPVERPRRIADSTPRPTGRRRRVEGRVLAGRGVVVAGRTVELFVDEALTVAVAQAATDADGRFGVDVAISAEQSIWMCTAVEQQPARTPLLNPWTPGASRHELFVLETPPAHSGAAPTTRRVTVLDADGRPPGGGVYRAILVERTARACVVHDADLVPASGSISLRLLADRRLTRAEPDVFVRLETSDGTPVIDSTSFDIRLPPRFATRNSELERVHAAIEVAGVSVEDLTDDDVDYIAQRTGVSPTLVATAKAAAHLSRDLKVGSNAAYAWLRAATDGSDLHGALQRARDHNIAPATTDDDVATLVSAVEMARRETALVYRGRFDGADLDTVLQRALPDRATRGEFAAGFLARGRAPGFWDDWATRTSAAAVTRLKFTTEVARLTDHAEVVRALENELDAGRVTNIESLAAWSPARWGVFLSRLGVRSPGAFATVTGDETRGLILYAERLANELAAHNPTIALLSAMDENLGAFPAWVHPVQAFLRARPQHRLEIDPRDLRDMLTSESEQQALRGLDAIHRLLRLPVSSWLIPQFLTHGFASARDIARIAPPQFLQTLGAGDNAVPGLLDIHDRATSVAAKAVVLRAAVGRGQALSGGSKLAEWKIFRPRVSWDSLFGDADRARCACEMCRSVYSPASYLVALLETLDAHPKGPGCSRSGARIGTVPTKVTSLAELFRGCRADVHRLLLSCENTNIAVPTIDLVIELLVEFIESYAARPGQPPASGCQPASTKGTSAERRAEPESLRAPRNLDLAAAKFPWTLPYSFERHRGLLALEQLGLPLAEVRDAVRDLIDAPLRAPGVPTIVGTDAVDRARALDILGCTETEWQILVTEAATAATAAPFWPGLYVVSGVVPVRTLMSTTGLGYGELFVIVASRFVRGGSDCSVPTVAVTAKGNFPLDTCAVDELEFHGLSWDRLDRLHRFVRLMRRVSLGADDLDNLLLVLGATGKRVAKLEEAELIDLAHALAIRQQAGRSLVELLPLFGDVSNQRPCRVAQPGERLVSPFAAVFDCDPVRVTAAIAQIRTVGDGPALTALAGLADLTSDEAAQAASAILQGAAVETWMSSESELVRLTSCARRLRLLADLTRLEVEDVVALAGLANLDLFSIGRHAQQLSVDVWRFLRFAKATHGWALRPRALAWACDPSTPHRAAQVDDLGPELVQLASAFDLLEIELPEASTPSREVLAALLGRMTPAPESGHTESLDVEPLLDVIDALPWIPAPAGVGAALDPAVIAALGLGSFAQVQISDATAKVAAAIAGAPTAASPALAAAVGAALVPQPTMIGTPTTADDLRRAIEDSVESSAMAKVWMDTRGAGRSDAAYDQPVEKVLRKARYAAEAGTLSHRVVELALAITSIDPPTSPPQPEPNTVADATIAAYLHILEAAVRRGGTALERFRHDAAQAARAHAYAGLRTHALKLRRETAVIGWLGTRYQLDQSRAALLVRDLVPGSTSDTQSALASLIDGGGRRIRDALAVATYANPSAPVRATVSTRTAGFDLDWAGKAPAQGISADGFDVTLVLKGVQLEKDEVFALRTTCAITEVVVAPQGGAPSSSSAASAGWLDVFTATAASVVDIKLVLRAPTASGGSPTPQPRVQSHIRANNGAVRPLHNQIRLDLERDLLAVQRGAMVMQAFPSFNGATWLRLRSFGSSGSSPSGSGPSILAILPNSPWLQSYRRLEALRLLRERASDDAAWTAYLDARNAGTPPASDVWADVQGLGATDAEARRQLIDRVGLAASLDDELVLIACDPLVGMAASASMPPAAAVALVLPPATASTTPASPPSDAEVDAIALAALRTQQPGSRARELLQAAHDPVRLRYRDALVARLLYHEQHRGSGTLIYYFPRFDDIPTLNQYLLTDTQVSCCDATSRVQFAYGAVQAFIEGVLDQSIRPPRVSDEFWLGSLELLDREWIWKRHYRLWEANMNLFLTPENWLEDETRGDETHAFRELREALRQGELTTPAAERALTAYLRCLHELSRLEILATVTHEGDCSPIPLGFRQADLAGTHVIARTRSLPYRYFYRRRLPPTDGRWLSWEPLDVDVEGDAFDLVIHNNRLWFLWATLKPGREDVANVHDDASNASEAAPRPSGNSTAQRADFEKSHGRLMPPQVKQEVRLHWLERMHGTWTSRGSAPKPVKFTLDAEGLRRSIFRVALRSIMRGDRLHVHALIRTAVGEAQEPVVLPEGLVPLHRWVHPTIHTTFLTTLDPTPLGHVDPELPYLADRFGGNQKLKERWKEFYYSGIEGYVLPPDSEYPGAVELAAVLSRETGDVLYEVGLGKVKNPWVKLRTPCKVLKAGTIAAGTQALRRFFVNQEHPEGSDKKWGAHYYGVDAPGPGVVVLDEEGEPNGECSIWYTREAVVAEPDYVVGWVGFGVFDIGPAGDVVVSSGRVVGSLEYAAGQLADGCGYLSNAGSALKLPNPAVPTSAGTSAQGTLREALGEMPGPYRIVMETANGTAPESNVPRFVDELRGKSIIDDPLRTFFCEHITVNVTASNTDVGGEVDFDCVEKAMHESGKLGFHDTADIHPRPLDQLFRPDRLMGAISRAHDAVARRGPIGKSIATAFGAASSPGGTGPGALGRPQLGDLGTTTRPPIVMGPPGGRGDFPPSGQGGLLPPDEQGGSPPPGGLGGFPQTGDVRHCITHSIPGRLRATRIANLSRRASHYTTSATIAEGVIAALGGLGVTMTPVERWVVRPFYQPFTSPLFGALAQGATPGLMDAAGAQERRSFFDQYDPQTGVVVGIPNASPPDPLEPFDEIDYSDTGPFADYNWELTYHAPMLVARRLTQLGRFEDARRWFNLVFDPRAATTDPRTAFRCRPIRDAASESPADLLRRLADPRQSDDALLRQVRRFTNEPFRPHLIARSRPLAYAKATVIAYIEFLIAWGDARFRTDDRTSIEEARRHYEEAQRLLGDVPEILPLRAEVSPTCYAQLYDEGRTGPYVIDPLVELEGLIQPEAIEGAGGIAGGIPSGGSLTLYFCFPGNDRFDTLKTTIADRLMKIRACQNLEGIERELSLYGTRIDPGLIARAVAAGVSPADVFNELNAPLPRFRFKELVQRAKEVCADARALGQALLSTLEKQDSESYQQLRADIELDTLKNLRKSKAKQLEEAQTAKEAADNAQVPAEARKTFYSTRKFMNADELAAAEQTVTAMGVRGAAAFAGLIAQGASAIPDFTQSAHAQLVASGTSTVTKLGGGSTAAQVFQAVQSVANLQADITGTSAGIAREQGGYQRRAEDWALQADLATKELAILEKQSAAAEVRAALAQIEIDNHEQQVTHAEASRDFMRTKFSNAELYGWMSSRLAGLYYEQFRLAYETALQAQRAWQYELGTEERPIVGSPWNPGKRGLTAADELAAKLHQLEIGFDQKKPYDHAKSPDIRLSEVAPRALIQLRNTGACEFEIPEEYFDSIEPGGCFRRWKAIAVTVPCVRGPSAVLDGRLTLLAHSRRNKPGREPPVELSHEVGGRDYIELTHGNRDFGLPEGAGQEGWRLPFEGAGAISRWRLELPLETNSFDRRSLTDVVLHTVYTARQGTPQDRAAARAAAQSWPPSALLDIPSLFPEEWHTFKRTGVLKFTLRPEHFPKPKGRLKRAWERVMFYVETTGLARAIRVNGTVGGAPLPNPRWPLIPSIGSIEADQLALGDGSISLDLADAAGTASIFACLQ